MPQACRNDQTVSYAGSVMGAYTGSVSGTYAGHVSGSGLCRLCGGSGRGER